MLRASLQKLTRGALFPKTATQALAAKLGVGSRQHHRNGRSSVLVSLLLSAQQCNSTSRVELMSAGLTLKAGMAQNDIWTLQVFWISRNCGDM
jgi:hypothetical protein